MARHQADVEQCTEQAERAQQTGESRVLDCLLIDRAYNRGIVTKGAYLVTSPSPTPYAESNNNGDELFYRYGRVSPVVWPLQLKRTLAFCRNGRARPLCTFFCMLPADVLNQQLSLSLCQIFYKEWHGA